MGARRACKAVVVVVVVVVVAVAGGCCHDLELRPAPARAASNVAVPADVGKLATANAAAVEALASQPPVAMDAAEASAVGVFRGGMNNFANFSCRNVGLISTACMPKAKFAFRGSNPFELKLF